jgi:FMN phosphatase YigB (HAD superfamily)
VGTKLLVLDFDGTMTDAEAEGAPFRGGYLDDIAALSGLPRDEVESLAERFEAEVAAHPEAHGWVFNGQIVAPATVDPYLRIMPVARKILDHAGCFLDETDRTRMLDAILYKYNYQKTLDVPQAGAGPVLRGMAGKPLYVVTNSHTAAVQRKIRQIGAEPGSEDDLQWLVDRVFGRARKYVVEPSFEALPATLELPGLSRPVLLRRKLYHDALDALRVQEGAAWDEVVVVGDIFELDLSVPLAMGARVGLMVNPFTPAWEKDYLATHPRGALLNSVSEIPPYVGW